MLSAADMARMERYETDGTVTGVAARSLTPGEQARVRSPVELTRLAIEHDSTRPSIGALAASAGG